MDGSNGNSDCHDVVSLLSSDDRDFLIHNTGDKVKIKDLVGKSILLYFSASWCGPCRHFTPTLIELYEELSPKGEFEVIFVSSDKNTESFNDYFSKMPWLAIPFDDSEPLRKQLKELFKVRGIPSLAILDKTGTLLSNEGVRIIKEYGADAHPFKRETFAAIAEEEERAKKEQSLRSLLVSESRDFLISNDGSKVTITELEGKIVGLYFSFHYFPPCAKYTTELVEFYKQLKEKGENFEIVLVSLDHKEEAFKEGFEKMPWLALPFNDKCCEKLYGYFDLKGLPKLVIIGEDGKTLNHDVSELVEEHGVLAYPFSSEKILELAEIEKAKHEAQTLESLLVHGEADFVIDKSGSKVLVSELVGKNILMYFSAHWCPPCRDFTPKLVTAYHDIKAKDEAFEVIFISRDRDQSSFDEYYSTMPWFALPFGDERKSFLERKFKIRGIPTAIAIGPGGRTTTTSARKMVDEHGSDAYPFTEERLKHLEERLQENDEELEKLKHSNSNQ